MKKLTSAASFLTILLILSANAYGQDADLERLKKIVAIIEKVNALPVEFERALPNPLPIGAANVNKQAELLKQLPPGTVIEIGVHTFAVGNEAKNVTLTQTRADKVKVMLIAAGVSPQGLSALGYGSSKPLSTDATDPKNRRLEYRVTNSVSSPATPITAAGTIGKNIGSVKTSIVGGQGWGRVEIGAGRSQVESILGSPEYFGIDSTKPEDSYATYFQKGVIVVYGTKDLAVKLIRFIGNAALYSDGKSKFQSFQGIPDKGLKWNDTSAQVINAYGAPAKREAYEGYPDKIEIVNLHYPGIHFILKGDKLLQINILTGGPASSAQAVETAKTTVTKTPIKMVDNRSGEELFDAVEKNQMDQVREMIKRGVGLNFERKDETTLIVAIRNRRVEMARMLLEAGADPEFAESVYGGTPLRWAVQMTDIDTLKLLIDKYKVNVNVGSLNHISPLHTAADFGQDDRVTKILLDAGANANVVNGDGQSPLDLARRWKKTAIVTLLERATNADEIVKKKIAWAIMPKSPKPVREVAVSLPTPPKPKKTYGPDEDDPDEVASIVSSAKTAARRVGFELHDEGIAVRQGRNSNSESGGIQMPVFQGTVYQFVIISKDALAINAIMNGTLLTVPCNSCRTSISTYSTSIEKSSSQNGYYMLSFQMQLENYQNNYVTFIPKGNTAGAPIKWLYFTKQIVKN